MRIRAYDAPPDPLVVRGFLPSAIAASRLRRLHFPQISQDLSPQSYIQIFASVHRVSMACGRPQRGGFSLLWTDGDVLLTS